MSSKRLSSLAEEAPSAVKAFLPSMKELVESGAHWGHRSNRWNPLMKDYLFAKNQNGVSIIDLRITQVALEKALTFLYNLSKDGKRILFVGTKPCGAEIIKETAEKTGQYYVNYKWLGGMLTNWKTIRQSIKTMEAIEESLQNVKLTKKQALMEERKLEKLSRNLCGVRNMGGLPDVVVTLGTCEDIAIKEAKVLGIPVISIVDSNGNPHIEYPVPGNDDSIDAIQLYFSCIQKVLEEGMVEALQSKSKKNSANDDLMKVFAENSEISPEKSAPDNTSEKSISEKSVSTKLNSETTSNN